MYEYVGEVIGPTPFQRKMKEYANEGIKHFYFMALDKDVVRSVLPTIGGVSGSADVGVTVHRRDQARRERAIPEPLL